MSVASQPFLERVQLTQFCVDSRLCIGCGLCEERAPGNLEVPAGADSAHVFQQPADEFELITVGEAADYCPTGALARVPGANATRRERR